MIRLGVVADDLTGALDTGAQFVKQGSHTVVLIEGAVPDEADVVVIDTESRADEANEACEKVRRAVRTYEGVPVYKKVDSTLRGNVAVELEALMDELGLGKALVAPAFPTTGRTTVEGHQLVHGVVLEESCFAEDPLCPGTGYIPALLAQATERQVGHINLGVVEGGPATLAKQVQQSPEQILVIDASSEAHLRCIARVVYSLREECIPCGSAGLAQELAVVLPPRGKNRTARQHRKDSSSALIVCGSRHPATIQQVYELRRELGTQIVEADAALLLHRERRWAEIDRVGDTIARLLRERKDVILTPAFGVYMPEKRKEIARSLGEIARLVATRQDLSALFLTGGDTAIHICRALGIDALRIEEEVSPGMPAASALRGPHKGLRLVTKAGGFGDEKALVRATLHLRS